MLFVFTHICFLWNAFCTRLPVCSRKVSVCSRRSRTYVQSYPGYPYLGYPNPRLSERSSERAVCLKSMVFSLKSHTLRQSRVHVFVCHTYMFNIGTQWYVILHSVMCKGLQTRPSYIFVCYNSMYIARKVSFGLSEQFHLSEQPIKPLCPKVFR